MMIDVFEDLIDHLTDSAPLSQGEASRVIADVLAYFSEDVSSFIRRRHSELKCQGLTNEKIFAIVSAELPTRLFAAPQLSVRQLRRIIYG